MINMIHQANRMMYVAKWKTGAWLMVVYKKRHSLIYWLFLILTFYVNRQLM